MRWEQHESDHWWYRARREMVGRIAANGHHSILDIGCGNGAMFYAFDKFKIYVGIDKSKFIVRKAKRKAVKMNRSNVNVIIASGNALCFKENIFDLVICADVLEHVQDDYGAVGEMSRVMKNGGEAIITIPAFRKLWGRQDEEQHHFRRYHLFEIRHLIESSGLEVTYLRYWNSTLMPLATIFRRFLNSDIKAEMRSYSRFNSLLYYLLRAETVMGEKFSRLIFFGVSLVVKARKS